MKTVIIDLEKVQVFKVGQQYSQNDVVLKFINIDFGGDLYINVMDENGASIDSSIYPMPLFNNQYIISEPLTSVKGTYKAQLMIKGFKNEYIALTKIFYMIVEESLPIEDIDTRPVDPNLLLLYEQLNDSLNTINQLKNDVQSLEYRVSQLEGA